MSSPTLTSSRTQTRNWAAAAIFLALFVLLFQYRILSLMNHLGAAVNPIGTKLPIPLDLQTAPVWLQPVYSTIDYFNGIWFTTLLGLFIAGAVIAFLPDFIHNYLRGNSWSQHLAGALLGIPNMLCTCCASTTLPGLRKAGTGLGASLAFFVAAPSLNIVVILLGFQLLPLRYAIARLALGVIASVGVTYVIARLHPEILPQVPADMPFVSGSGRDATCRVSTASSAAAWLRATWDTAKIALPLLVVGIFAISVLKTFVPIETLGRSLGNGLLPTAIASLIGTVVMVPTFTDVLWVADFAKHGIGAGPAFALLATLPTVSFPSLWVLGKVYGSYRMALSLGLGIFLLGIVSGVVLGAI